MNAYYAEPIKVILFWLRVMHERVLCTNNYGNSFWIHSANLM